MAKKQTRRSISIRGITYQRLKNFCEAQEKTMSGFLEELITQRMDELGIPMPTSIDPPRERAAKTPDEIISQHFTF